VGTATVALGATSLASADGDDGGVSAAVGGISNPASGVLNVEVQARDEQGRLASTSVTVDDAQVATASLCENPATGCQAEKAGMALDTQALADGAHHVVVSVTDADGHTITPVDQSVEVLNHPATGSPTATLNLGAGAATPQGAQGNGSGGGVEGASASSCTSPRLSMLLAQRPLRVSHGVPVLQAGKRYRFSGRLTCVIGGKRRSAPHGTRVSLVQVVHGRRVHKGGAVVRDGGRLTAILSIPSSRAVEFRATAANGTSSKVRIRVMVSRKRKG
jgi:hypothetical protein